MPRNLSTISHKNIYRKIEKLGQRDQIQLRESILKIKKKQVLGNYQ